MSELDALIDRYQDSLQHLHHLADTTSAAEADHDRVKIADAEAEVEKNFNALLNWKPRSKRDLIGKMEFFAEDAAKIYDFTSYHQKFIEQLIGDIDEIDLGS